MLFGALALAVSFSAVAIAGPAELRTPVDEAYDGSAWSVLPGGTLALAWHWRPSRSRNYARELRSATRTPSGAWQAPSTIASSSANDLLLWDLEVDGAGTTYALYQAGGDGPNFGLAKRLALRVQPRGGAWSAEELVASEQAGFGGAPSKGEMVVRPDGTAVIVWCEQTERRVTQGAYAGQTLIRTADRLPDGMWSEPVTLWTQEPNAQCSGSITPQISIEQNGRGDVVAIWHDAQDVWDENGQYDQLDELVAAVRPLGTGWSPSHVVGVERDRHQARVAVGPSGRGHIALSTRQTTPKYAAVSFGGVEVGPTTIPGALPARSTTETANIAVDATEAAVLVWDVSYGSQNWDVSRPTTLTAARRSDGQWSGIEPLDPLEPSALTAASRARSRALTTDTAGNIAVTWAEWAYRTTRRGGLELTKISALQVVRPSGARWGTRAMVAVAPGAAENPFFVPSSGIAGAGHLLWPGEAGFHAQDLGPSATRQSRTPSLTVPRRRVSAVLRARELVVQCRVDPNGFCSVRLQPDSATARTFKDPRASCVELSLRSRANAQGVATVRFRVKTVVDYCRRWISRSSWRFTAYATADAVGAVSAQRRQTITIRK